MEKNLSKLSRTVSDEFLNFISKAVSPFHAIKEAKELLNLAGFKEIFE